MVALETIKQLNQPQSLDVQTGPNGEPSRIRLRAPESTGGIGTKHRSRDRTPHQQVRAIRSDRQWMTVVAIEDCWKINDEWWRGEELEIERLYFDVVLDNNQRLTIFHDPIRGTWARQAE